MSKGMKKLIIVGISTNARHVYELVKQYQLFDVVGFCKFNYLFVDDTFIHDFNILFVLTFIEPN